MQHQQIALVTGAARGVGAEVARQLAQDGAHVIVTHRDRGDEAQAVVHDILTEGGQASAVNADIADDRDVAALIDQVTHRFGQLDTLVLHAASSSAGRARFLVEKVLPLMPAGSRIVFVTSNQAHFYPNKGVVAGYGRIAARKRADETTLYAMRAELRRRGIHYTVVAGDFVDTGVFPQHDGAVREFATTVARAAVEPHPLSIVHTGSELALAHAG